GGRGGRGGAGNAAGDTPHPLAPTGVPGGLATDAATVAGGRRGGAAAGPFAVGTPRAGVNSGLLGPVRLLAP
ncbi:MAG TPA: hypothetical protein VHD62_03105, partial [Opitutaceae bacterium]|nr:hypothetical protein [Opitutaceae bacterium]